MPCADRTTLLAELRRLGDSAVDDVIASATPGSPEAYALGMLASGREPAGDGPVAALHQTLFSTPAWADPERMRRGSRAYLAAGSLWVQLILGAGSLVNTYRSPSIAEVLGATGRLTAAADRRVQETGHWLLQAVLPDAILPGRPGHLATLQVRLLHARIRARLLAQGWDTRRWGLPISQADLGRTLLDFSHTPLVGLERVGWRLRPVEQADSYHLWAVIGHHLGVDPRLRPANHAEARELAEWLDVDAVPTPRSQELVQALVAVYVGFLPPLLHLSSTATAELVRALVARLHGGETFGQLALPAPAGWTTPVLDAVSAMNWAVNHLQLALPSGRQWAADRAAAQLTALTAQLEGRPAYQVP
jgi:hypothetical protein